MQEETLYRNILREGWKFTWKNKALWLLGFLAVFWGDVGAYQALNQAVGSPLYPETASGGFSLAAFTEFLSFGGFVFVLFLLFILLAFLLALILAVTAGRGGLLYLLAQRAQQPGRISLRAGLRKGVEKFWPLLGIGIVSRLDVPLYAFWFGRFENMPNMPGAFSISFAAGFVILTLLSLILSFLGIYASLLIISEDRRFCGAIADSLRIFARNWLVSIELSLILYLITLGVGIATVAALFVIAVPFLFLGALLSILGSSPLLLWIIISPAIALAIALLIVVGSAFVTFQYSAWVLLFQRIRSDRALAKVVRLTARFGNLLHRKIV